MVISRKEQLKCWSYMKKIPHPHDWRLHQRNWDICDLCGILRRNPTDEELELIFQEGQKEKAQQREEWKRRPFLLKVLDFIEWIISPR